MDTRGYTCVWAIVAAVFLSGGCALTTDHISLEYVPQASAGRITDADTVNLSLTVVDKRSVKDKVSCKKNAYGMEMPPIVAANDVSATVADAVRAELVNRGYVLGCLTRSASHRAASST